MDIPPVVLGSNYPSKQLITMKNSLLLYMQGLSALKFFSSKRGNVWLGLQWYDTELIE